MGCCGGSGGKGDEDEGDHEEYTKGKSGPMHDRKCRDVIFLILFIAFWVGMFYVASQAVKHGNPRRLLYGVDYEGNICGTNNIAQGIVPANKSIDFTNSSFLYFMPADPTFDDRGYIDICVPTCPNKTYFPIPTSTDEVLCPYNTTKSLFPPCYGTFNSQPIVHRCVPRLDFNVSDEIGKNASQIISALNLQHAADLSIRIFGTLVRSWKYIAVGAAASLVVSFVWLILIAKLAGVLVYLTIFLVHVILAVLAYFVYHELQNADQVYNSVPPYLRLASKEELIKMLKGLFAVVVAALVIIFLITLCMWQRIGIAIEIIKEASKAVIRIPTILLVPIGTGLCIAPLAVYWIYIGAYLGTTGTPRYDADGKFQGYDATGIWIRMQLYHLFGGFWALNFLFAISETVIAGAVASWYWVHDKKDMPNFPVAASIYRVIRYHLGSMAFGSLILAIVQFIRFLLQRLEDQIKGKENRIVACVFKVLKCLLAVFEKFIKFLNKNAYIMIAIYGYSFCTGARRGFSLIAGNFLRVAALNMVSGFVIFLGKLFVSVTTALGAFLVLRRNSDEIGDFVIPTIAIGILAYAIAKVFFSVFDMAVDTILLCFCEDSERNNGQDRPYYMSDALRKHMEQQAKTCCCC